MSGEDNKHEKKIQLCRLIDQILYRYVAVLFINQEIRLFSLHPLIKTLQ